MEFPITIESQEKFNELVSTRLAREKTKQDQLQSQLDVVTAEKQDLESKNNQLTQRATAAEQWKQERESADTHATLVKQIAEEFSLDSSVLRGSTEEELRSHAEVLKPLVQQPVAPVVPGAGQSPNKNSDPDPAREFLRDIGLGDE